MDLKRMWPSICYKDQRSIVVSWRPKYSVKLARDCHCFDLGEPSMSRPDLVKWRTVYCGPELLLA